MDQENSAPRGDGREITEGRGSTSRETSRTLSPERTPQEVNRVPKPHQRIIPSSQTSATAHHSNAGLIDLTKNRTTQNTTIPKKRCERDMEDTIIVTGNKRAKKADTLVDLTDDAFNHVDIPLAEIIDLEAEEEVEANERIVKSNIRQTPRSAPELPKRNQPINYPFKQLETYPFHQYTLRSNKVVEYIGATIGMAETETQYNEKKQWLTKPINGFLVIKNIVQNLSTGEVTLRGWRAIRTIDLMGKLETGKGTKNELSYIHEVELDDPRDMWEQSVHEVPIGDVVQIRQVRMTNKTRAEAPELRYSEEDLPNHLVDATKQEKNKYMANKERMVLRWAFIMRFENSLQRRRNSSSPTIFDSFILRPLLENECTHGLAKSAEAKRSEWRQEDIEVIEVDGVGSKKYTFFDSFCGAGGTSKGAADAGLQLSHAFDNWDDAARTYRANFPHVNMMDLSVDEFCSSNHTGNYRCDILHLSCPCQYYSPNNTRKGTACNDESNQAASFCVNALLKKVRPRFVHSEQTFGMLRPSHWQDFNIFLSQFTDLGFSVSWQIRDFKRDGLPQARRRLLMIAAAPGETLPDFPAYKHSKNHLLDGLKPFTTVQDVFDLISPTAPNHNIQEASTGKKYPPWNARTPFRNTICSAGLVCGYPKPARTVGHPNGNRMATITEIAVIQGACPLHRFEGRSRTANYKLIGNMYPSSMARIQYRNLRRHLEDTDKKRRAQGIYI